jgi:hypothetical protein
MARIYQTHEMGMADVRAALVGSRGEADLCVLRVSSQGLAMGDARWYICRSRQEAQVSICFCSRGMAELRVCFVDNYTEAGWQRPHRLKGRLERWR